MAERRSAKPEGMPQEMWDRSMAGAGERLHWAGQDLWEEIGKVLEPMVATLDRFIRRLRDT